MKDVRLSICIATLNRAAFIGQTLDSILAQITDDVEIVVVDGASTDGTEVLLRKYREEHGSIRYCRMEKNSGLDRDYDNAVLKARGEYCWFMSDDDILLPGAIEAVLGATGKGYSVLVVNAEDWNTDLSRRLGSGRLRNRADRVYSPAENESFFMDAAGHLSFIPALVVRRDLWLGRERERYFGSWFAHVGVVFQAPLPGGALIMAKPVMAVRNGNVSWGSRTFEIWMFKWPELIWSLPGISEASKRKVVPENPSKRWMSLFGHRAIATYSRDVYRRLVMPRIDSWGSRIVASSIAVFPVRLANFLSFLYSLLTYPDSRITLYTIVNSRYFCFPMLKGYFSRKM